MRVQFIFMVAAMVILPSFSFGQKIQVGVKAGASIPDIEGNTEQSKDYTSRLAPFFGVSVVKKLSRYLNFQAELNYSPQGGKRNGMQPIDASASGWGVDTILWASFKNETKLNYLELPLLMQFESSKGKKANSFFYFANFGPYVSLRVKAKTVTSGSSQIYLDQQGSMPLTLDDGTPLPPQSFDGTTDIKGEIKRINFGLVGGFGTGYNFNGQTLFIEARFTRGLVNIQTHPEQSGKNKTGSLIFAAGYLHSF